MERSKDMKVSAQGRWKGQAVGCCEGECKGKKMTGSAGGWATAVLEAADLANVLHTPVLGGPCLAAEGWKVDSRDSSGRGG